MSAPNVKLLTRAGAKWRRYAARLAASLPRGGSKTRLLGGFLIQAKRIGRFPKALILDLPSRLAVFDDIYDNTTLVTDRAINIAPSRDGFMAGGSPSEFTAGDTFSEDTWSSTRTRNGLFVFGELPPENGTRYVDVSAGFPYDGGTSKFRRTYAFRSDPGTVELYPYTYPGSVWAYAEFAGTNRNDTLEIAISENIISQATGGWLMYPRAMGDNGAQTQYPVSLPLASCARRTLPDGRDIAVMAIPVTKPLAPYDAQTNNTDAGYSGVYIFGVEVASDGSVPTGLTTLYSSLVSNINQTGALSVPQWSGNNDVPLGSEPLSGVMPNRFVGDVAIDDVGRAFWAGSWEVSRERDDSFLHITHTQNVVSFNVGVSGVTNFTVHSTNVFIGDTADTPYGYLAMDSDPTNPHVTYATAITCFAPYGRDPFLVAIGSQFVRETISNLKYEAAPTGESLEIWYAEQGVPVTRLEATQYTYFNPGADITVTPLWESRAPQMCLLDANPAGLVVSLPLRNAFNINELMQVELSLDNDELTLRGIIGTSLFSAVDLYPFVTCFQRAQSIQDNLLRTRTHEGGMVITYGEAGEGYTLVSNDSGQTWTRVANFAAQRGAYYIGSGFFGTTFDQMLREVDDNG